MIKKLLIVLLLIIVAFVAVVAMQPSDFRVSRSATIAAPPAVVFGHVNNLKQWNDWSPWAKRDPNMKTTYEGPESGEGAVYAWAGNQEVGEGRMTITASRPAEAVEMKLEFLKPMEATNEVEFKFAPEGDQTRVTWSMLGRNNFVGKAFCLFMDMDKMVGGDFEKGLADLKTISEKEAASAAPAPEPAPAPSAPAEPNA